MKKNLKKTIFTGILAIFLYNYFASYLRAIGNSITPLIFLGLSSFVNIALDLCFVISLNKDVIGAAKATVIAQYLSGIGILLYTFKKYPQVFSICKVSYLKKERIKEIVSYSILTCLQQSVMNLGILMVQGWFYVRARLWQWLLNLYCSKLWCIRS